MNRLLKSIKGIIVGVVIFVGAFPLLWWGEGRQDLSEFIQKAKLIDSQTVPQLPIPTLIKLTGLLTSDESIRDDPFLLYHPKLKFLALHRQVEMYSWREEKKTEKRGDKEVTTYDYRKEWTQLPQDSAKFYDGNNHKNPKPQVDNQSWRVSRARIGQLSFDGTLTDFHGSQPLPLFSELRNSEAPQMTQVSGNYLYLPIGVTKDSLSTRQVALTPEVGDLRLSYSYFPSEVEGALVGSWDGLKIVPHIYDENKSYLGVFVGSLDAFQKKLHREYQTTTWMIRVGALLMMWVGLQLILGPLTTIISAVPVAGAVGRVLISLVCGVVAVTLWLLTLFLANFWLLLVAIFVLGGGALFYLKNSRAIKR